MSVKQKFNFFFKKNVFFWYSYDFDWFLWKFYIISANFFATRIFFMKRIRILLAKMKRIRNTAEARVLG